MSLSRFVSVVAGRRVAFLVALFSVLALALLAAFVVRPSYTARAQVLVQQRASQLQAGVNVLAGETDLVQSERVSIAALRLLGLENDPAMHSKWQDATGGNGSFESWASDQLLRKLDVKPGRDSGILTISYSSTDPSFAARVANAFVKAYVATSGELREEGSSQSAASFAGSTKDLKAALEAAQQKLSTFQQDNGIASNDERVDVETLRLAELSAQLVAAQTAAATAASRQRGAAASGSEEELRDPLVASLGTELARQEAKLGEMRARMGDGHPMLAEQKETIAAMSARLAAARARASSVVAAESKVASDRTASIQAALDAQRAKVLEMKSRRDQAVRLQREEELARKSYDAAVTRMNETALDSGATRGTVSVLKTATVPARPSSPRPLASFIASLLVGVLAGIAAAFWRESRDRRLRLDQDVADLLDHRLVAVISSAPHARLGYAPR